MKTYRVLSLIISSVLVSAMPVQVSRTHCAIHHEQEKPEFHPAGGSLHR
jgi:hypothetical protein